MGGNPLAGIWLVLKSPYLLGVAAFVILLSSVSTFLYFEQLALVRAFDLVNVQFLRPDQIVYHPALAERPDDEHGRLMVARNVLRNGISRDRLQIRKKICNSAKHTRVILRVESNLNYFSVFRQRKGSRLFAR